MEFYKCAVCGKIVAMVKDGFGDVVCCDVPMEKLAAMNILLMPATLKKAEGETLSRDERDILRAKKVRENAF